MSKRILIIDDDEDNVNIIKLTLEGQGFQVDKAHNGRDGLKKAYANNPDLIILDVMMPEMDGFEVCSRLRDLTDIPILMLTAKHAEHDVLRAFRTGVDDFVNKPYSLPVLNAKIKALLSRKERATFGSNGIKRYQDKNLTIDLEKQQVCYNNETLQFSPTEFKLLSLLLQHNGRLVRHQEIIFQIWGNGYRDGPRLLNLYIFYIRKKLKDAGSEWEYIRTQWGTGYLFMPMENETEATI